MSKLLYYCRLSLFIIVIFSLSALIISGVWWTTDVSADKRVWGQYEKDKSYRLNMDLFILEEKVLDIPLKKILALPRDFAMPEGRFYSAPLSIEIHERHGRNSSEENISTGGFPVIGIARKGIKIKADRVERTVGWHWWSGSFKQYEVIGVIESGKFKGSELRLFDVSRSHQDVAFEGAWFFTWAPEPIIFDERYYSE